MLGSSERKQVEAHAGALRKTLDRTPENSADAAAETLVLVTKLMLALPGARASETSADATADAYEAALDDLPPWAVAAAIRHWYRGNAIVLDSKAPPHDYRWRPAPAILRKLAYYEMMVVRGRMQEMQRLIEAVPLIEYSDQHTADMRAKLRTLPIVGGLIETDEAVAEARMRKAERLGARIDRLAERAEAAE